MHACMHTHTYTMHTYAHTHTDDGNIGRQDKSIASPLCENHHTTANNPALTTVTTTELEVQGSTDSNTSTGTVIGIVILGCVFVAACLAFLIIAAVIYKKYHSCKKQSADLVDKCIVGHDGKLVNL